jgi:hypothetical protein
MKRFLVLTLVAPIAAPAAMNVPSILQIQAIDEA